MKKYFIIITILSALLFSSCEKESTSGLDGSVSERIEETIAEYKKTLSEAPHGWIAYVETNQGLYRFWMEFDNVAGVKMLTDNSTVENGAKDVRESSYSIRQYQRPTLVFDTYTYISIINDPDNAISKGKDNQGLETDFEFEFVSYGEVEYNVGSEKHTYDAFKMEGRINLSKCLLLKATQEQKDEIQNARLAEEIREVGLYGGGINNHLSATINGAIVSFIVKPRTVLAITTQAGGAVVKEADPMLEVKSKNLLLDAPIEAGGVMIESFRWDETDQTYYAVAGAIEYKLNKSATAPEGLLDKIFGYKKPFTRIRMYQGFGYSFLDFWLLELSGIPVTSVDLYLSTDSETKEPIMAVEVWLFDRYPLAYTFTIVQDGDAFTTSETISFDNDSSGLAEDLYKQGATSGFVDGFKNRKYTITWGNTAPPAEYANETIVMFKSETTNSKNGVMLK